MYLITNLSTGKMYVGKKIFNRRNMKRVKGRKNRVAVSSDSDWREYYGSNDELKRDVAASDVSLFRREILHLCSTRGMSGYLEAREQFERRVLELPESYYNSVIQCRVHRNHVKGLQVT